MSFGDCYFPVGPGDEGSNIVKVKRDVKEGKETVGSGKWQVASGVAKRENGRHFFFTQFLSCWSSSTKGHKKTLMIDGSFGPSIRRLCLLTTGDLLWAFGFPRRRKSKGIGIFNVSVQKGYIPETPSCLEDTGAV